MLSHIIITKPRTFCATTTLMMTFAVAVAQSVVFVSPIVAILLVSVATVVVAYVLSVDMGCLRL